MYDPIYTSSFYDAYGLAEWRRLEATAYGRMQALIHADFIERAIRPGDRVLDIGSGPGRFSIVAARLGAIVTVADLSQGQVELARKHIEEAGLLDRIEDFVQADVADLAEFPSESFDLTICFGGALSYVSDRRRQAAAELARVTRPGGTLLVSVMSRYGSMANNVRRRLLPFLTTFRDSHLLPAIRTGDIPAFPSSSVPGSEHPAMHMYSAAELAGLPPDCEVLEIAGSNVSMTEGDDNPIASDPAIWATMVEVERALNRQSGLLDSGTHIIMAARRT